jgi:hypothetical protein
VDPRFGSVELDLLSRRLDAGFDSESLAKLLDLPVIEHEAVARGLNPRVVPFMRPATIASSNPIGTTSMEGRLLTNRSSASCRPAF